MCFCMYLTILRLMVGNLVVVSLRFYLFVVEQAIRKLRHNS